MLKALKIAMIVYAVAGLIVGLAEIFIPSEFASWFGLEEGSAAANANAVEIGFAFVALGVFLIIAARDPIKNILWVKYAIAFAALMLVNEIYSIIVGYVDFGQVVSGIAIHGVFAIAFLILYPWRQAKTKNELADQKK
jgi:hypothetical protein